MSDFYHNIEEEIGMGMVRTDRVLKHISHQNNRIEQLAATCEELEAKVRNLTKHHANMADFRYWEGRYRDEKSHNEELEAKLEKAFGLLDFLDANYFKIWGDTARAKMRTTLAELKGQGDG